MKKEDVYCFIFLASAALYISVHVVLALVRLVLPALAGASAR